jgi:hypothetical protein
MRPTAIGAHTATATGEKTWKCSECGWIGALSEMNADCFWAGDAIDAWSNCICPECGDWNSSDGCSSPEEKDTDWIPTAPPPSPPP